jgi:YHS domain-containing protein
MEFHQTGRRSASMVAEGLDRESRWVICPVCGHEVDATNPVGGSYEYEGETYYFCTREEREALARRPKRILEVAARRGGRSPGRHPYGHH